MAILQSCCCWRSVRTGSYASAAYTTLNIEDEFLILSSNVLTPASHHHHLCHNFAASTNFLLIVHIMLYFSITAIAMAMFLHEERWGAPEELPTGAINGVTPKSIGTSRNKATSGGVRSFLEPEGISEVTLYFGVAVLACATAGILASLLLIYGLYTDRRALLVPWVFTVFLTSLVDLAHTLYLLLLETMQFNPMTAILFTLDFFLLSLNVYSMLCVVSQYQEYKAGRGTAFHQHEVTSVRYEVQPTATTCVNSASRRPVSFLTPMGPLLEVRPSPNASPTAPLALSLQETSGHSIPIYPQLRGCSAGMSRSTKHVQFPDTHP